VIAELVDDATVVGAADYSPDTPRAVAARSR
jgi:hypothetical protein